MTEKFSLSAQKILSLSLAFARDLGHTYIGSEHILLAFLCEKDTFHERLLTGAGADLAKTRALITQKTGSGPRGADCVTSVTPNARQIIENSARYAEKDGLCEVSAENIFSALMKEKNSSAIRLLDAQGCKIYDITKELEAKNACESGESSRAQSKKIRKGDERMPSLQRYAKNMTEDEQCKVCDPLIGREKETDRIIRILIRRTKNNPCLIGDPGVGKTAIVEGLARRIVEGNVPSELCGAQIYSLDLPSMLAGAKYRGDFEERMKLVIDEASKNPSVILFIDELHTIIGAGSAEGAIDAANIIKPALARAKIKIIGATTLEEYRRHIEKDPAFERRFQSVTVCEPSVDESIEILKGLRSKYEKHHNVKIGDDAIEAAARLSHVYINDRFLPDKAIDLIDESAARVKIESVCKKNSNNDAEKVLNLALGKREPYYQSTECSDFRSGLQDCTAPTVCEQDIERTVTEWTGIPLQRLRADEESKFINLEETVKKRVIGQDEAVERVCSAVRRGKTSLRNLSRPLGSFIFTGPTGVGKTELAKTLADAIYGNERALLRLDMSEYCEAHSVSRLIGAPPGYIGYDDGGQLSEKVRRNPHLIVLFDEIEKAHRDVFELLLQIMDEGELSDSHGRRINFRSTIIIMTSNVGAAADDSSGSLGFLTSEEDKDSRVYKKLREVFSSEFLSRPDEIIAFSPLSYGSYVKIAEKMLSELRERLLSGKIKIGFSPEISSFIAKRCQKNAGARGIRRTIYSLVEDPLSIFLLSEHLYEHDEIYVSIEKERVVFTKNEKV